MGKMTIVVNNWRRMVVPIATRDSNMTGIVTAWVYGCFAIRAEKGQWVFMHVPTGMFVATYSQATYTQEDVARIAVDMQSHAGDRWNTGSKTKAAQMARSCSYIWMARKVPA